MLDNGNILFIIHDVYQDDNHFPLGPGYLSAILQQYGARVTIYNQDVYHYSNEELGSFLKNHTFDLIGLGFLAARFQETILDLCDVINKYKKDAWLVLGGHGPSPISEYMLEKTQADIVAIGESEETIVELLQCKLNQGDLSRIKGITYRQGHEIHSNPRRKPIQNLDSIPFPAWALFPMESYTTCVKYYNMTDKDRVMSIITSRGCINRCNFCYRMEKGIRFRSIKNVVDEIVLLNEKYGVTYLVMNDELFVYPKKRIFEFKDELERNDLKIKFDCNARVDVFDEEIAQCLKDCGCQFLNFGMESSDQRVLDIMQKNTTLEQNIKAAEIAKRMRIGTGLNFIWGNLGDTEESLKNNVKLIKKFNTYHYLRTIRPVTPYPGCDLYYHAIENGLLSGPDDFFQKFRNSDLITVNFTDYSLEKCYRLLFEANKDLILDHFAHAPGSPDETSQIIDNFYQLYFMGKTNFRGARHFNREKNPPPEG